MNIKELQDKILSYEAQLQEVVNDRSEDKSSEQKAIDAATISGKLQEARDMLVAAANAVAEENQRILAENAANREEKAKTFAETLLGARDSFTGIAPGWKKSVPINALSGLATPQIYRTDLPAPVDPTPMGILDTLPTGRVEGDEHYFQQGALDNKADTWTSGTKPESDIAWEPAVAHLETIAHWIPIPKLTARRYSSLESVVSGALILGLKVKERAHAVTGSNSSGIVGVINEPGIQTYTKQASDANPYDVAVEMARKVRVASGFAPNYVAVSSKTLTALKKLKDANGRYMYPEIVINGKIDGMTIVEDDNLSSSAEGMVVYFNGGAQWNETDADEVTVGLIDKQFVQNTYTLLAEGTHSLKMPFPKAFCYCAAL